mgnify:CR=1 FL=1
MITRPVFTNFPAPVDRSDYDDAVSLYVRAVAERSSAIYAVGNVNFPGLSDIDLIVVVGEAAWDNNHYFSPYVRLPKPLASLFHHEPRFLPETCLDAISFSSCVHGSAAPAIAAAHEEFGSLRRLVHGRDVLGARAVDVRSEPWRRCRLLETSFIFDRDRADLERERTVDVVKLMSRATRLRYPMRHLHDLLRMPRDLEFERRIDDSRRRLLDPAEAGDRKAETAFVALMAFCGALRHFDAEVRALFGIRRDEELSTAVVAMLSGERPVRGVDLAYVERQKEAAAGYYAALAGFRLSGGSIFATQPRRAHRKAYVQPFAHRIASSAHWRLRSSAARGYWNAVASATVATTNVR